MWQSIALRHPILDDFWVEPESDSSPIDECRAILFPVVGAVSGLLAFWLGLFGRFVSFHNLHDCQNRAYNYLMKLRVMA